MKNHLHDVGVILLITCVGAVGLPLAFLWFALWEIQCLLFGVLRAPAILFAVSAQRE